MDRKVTTRTSWRIVPRPIACLAMLLLNSCSMDDMPALRVGANIWPGYEPLYLARSLGYYDEHRIKLIDFPSAVEVIRAYRNGVIDVAALTADEALTVAETEPDLHRIILVTDYSAGADAIVARPEIKTLRELKGRKIGAEPNALGALMLTRALEQVGFTVEDVTVVPLSLERHETEYERGAVDAVVTFEPRRTRLLAQGAHEIFSSAQIPGEVLDVVMTRDSILKPQGLAFRQLIDGWVSAVQYMRAHPDDAALRMAPHQGLSPSEFLRSMRGLQVLDRRENLALLDGERRHLVESLDRLQAIMLSHGLLRASPRVESLPDARWLMERAP